MQTELLIVKPHHSPMRLRLGRSRGASLLELIVAIGLLTATIGVSATFVLKGYAVGQIATDTLRASLVANEGIEATRSIRDRSWSEMTNGDHGLIISSNRWIFSGTSDVANGFTRVVNISTVDSSTKKIISTVTWKPEPNRTATVTLKARLTSWPF